MSGVHDFQAENIAGVPVKLDQYQGKVLLIVNTASKCSFTPQYSELEALYRQYKDKGLEILGFPCNQFRQQEPGTAEDILAFCQKDYGVTFPLFAKIDVNGSHAHPLYQYLKANARGLLGSEAIKWNFTKFLVKRDGTVYQRFAPLTAPKDLVSDIEQLLS